MESRTECRSKQHSVMSARPVPLSCIGCVLFWYSERGEVAEMWRGVRVFDLDQYPTSARFPSQRSARSIGYRTLVLMNRTLFHASAVERLCAVELWV